MTRELQNKLIKKYYEFFKWLENYKGPIAPMSFGISCHDGWYLLLDNLMGNIKIHIEHVNSYNEKKIYLEIKQIKEKFGGLCFYYEGGDTEIRGMVRIIESLSYSICEFCGTTHNVGKTKKRWIYTICEDCRNKDERIKTLEWHKIED
jgi:hypothetical protein